jgi:TfoX/Sxy family transcriptional regulator of competence genes
MPYDEGLATRIRELLGERPGVVEKTMFGGLAFLIDGAMSVGVLGDELVARVGPARLDEAKARPGARPFDFSGRPMTGWLYVAAEGLESDEDLAQWIAWGVECAKASPKKARGARSGAPKAAKAAKAQGPGRPPPTPKPKLVKAAAKRQPSGRRH